MSLSTSTHGSSQDDEEDDERPRNSHLTSGTWISASHFPLPPPNAPVPPPLPIPHIPTQRYIDVGPMVGEDQRRKKPFVGGFWAGLRRIPRAMKEFAVQQPPPRRHMPLPPVRDRTRTMPIPQRPPEPVTDSPTLPVYSAQVPTVFVASTAQSTAEPRPLGHEPSVHTVHTHHYSQSQHLAPSVSRVHSSQRSHTRLTRDDERSTVPDHRDSRTQDEDDLSTVRGTIFTNPVLVSRQSSVQGPREQQREQQQHRLHRHAADAPLPMSEPSEPPWASDYDRMSAAPGTMSLAQQVVGMFHLFQALYRLPWVAQRVTVDYVPADGSRSKFRDDLVEEVGRETGDYYEHGRRSAMQRPRRSGSRPRTSWYTRSQAVDLLADPENVPPVPQIPERHHSERRSRDLGLTRQETRHETRRRELQHERSWYTRPQTSDVPSSPRKHRRSPRPPPSAYHPHAAQTANVIPSPPPNAYVHVPSHSSHGFMYVYPAPSPVMTSAPVPPGGGYPFYAVMPQPQHHPGGGSPRPNLNPPPLNPTISVTPAV